MPVESEADRASFFDPSEFAQVAEIRGKDIDGYFEESVEFLEGVSPVSIQSKNPTFQCSSESLPSEVEEGEPISVTRDDGTIFSGTVITNEPDGFGLTLLTLEDND